MYWKIAKSKKADWQTAVAKGKMVKRKRLKNRKKNKRREEEGAWER